MANIIALVLIFLIILTVRSAVRHRRGTGKILLWILSALLILLFLLLSYFLFYYHAQNGAKAMLPDTSVKIGTVCAWFFDGPGEDAALIFYPGAKVEAAAYAPLLVQIAESGVDCFLVEMPLHVAFLGINAADRIIEDHAYKNWVLAGHSLGGVAASSYAASHRDSVAGLVLLASYPTVELRGLPVLSIYGDRDEVLNRDSYEKSRVLWPDGAEELVISGGNHAQFGGYGPQRGDGEAAITPEEQQTQTVEAVSDWMHRHILEGTEAA